MSLLISEDFYSVQCEGISTGFPSYFVRLTNCNLSCGASNKFLSQVRKGEYDPGNFKGDLHNEGKATWTCDTIPVWLKGTERGFQYLLDRWKDQELLDYIASGLVHIIWTGGEPTLPKHQKAIIEFNRWMFNETNDPLISSFQEIETNGTIYIEEDLLTMLNQINCSPKLSNSGNGSLRYNKDALERIMEHDNYQFKFVISEERDLQEIFDQYINELHIPLNRVVCMPGLDSRENFHERTRFILEMAKKYKFIGLTRLHVSAWDRTTGV